MHRAIATTLLLLLPLGAAAQQQSALPVESISVEDGGPTGVWKFAMPGGFQGSFFLLGSTTWSPTVDAYCRIDKITGDLSIHCPGFHLGRALVTRGTVTIDGSRARMVWGKGARFGMEGTLRPGAQFEGVFYIENFLSRSTAPTPVTGTKLTLSATAPDGGGSADLLAKVLAELAGGTVPAWSLQTKFSVNIPTAEMLRPLGAVQAIVYLGEKAIRGEAPASSYDVEFANGNLICELRRHGDVLDFFDCG